MAGGPYWLERAQPPRLPTPHVTASPWGICVLFVIAQVCRRQGEGHNVQAKTVPGFPPIAGSCSQAGLHASPPIEMEPSVLTAPYFACFYSNAVRRSSPSPSFEGGVQFPMGDAMPRIRTV